MPKTIHCKNFNEMSKSAANFIAGEITSAKKQFYLALPGGNSVTGILDNLGKEKITWQAVNAFMADERFVPITDKDSNYWQASELLFSRANGIHSFPFDMQKGIGDYNSKFLAITKGKLDLVILGVGEDGHIASLFPNSLALKSTEEGYVLIEDAQKYPPKRITLSYESIINAHTVVLLFASESKRKAFENFANPAVKISDCPAKIALKAKVCVVFTAFGG